MTKLRISLQTTLSVRTSMALLGVIALFLPLHLQAQDEFRLVRGKCTPDLENRLDGSNARGAASMRRLPAINTQWDSNRTYRQLVILVAYPDAQFSSEDPRDFYDKIFNLHGYNEGKGVGCVADYFRAQSSGLFNLQFDLFDPVQVSVKAQPYDEPTSSTINYGRSGFKEAVGLFLEAHPDLDYSVYDWNGDGVIEQVIFISAGYCGNAGSVGRGYLWPNTSSFSASTTPDGLKISNYTASAERWPTASILYCGIGTICHEFSHSLGLPDIYPVNEAWTVSAIDEWDLMDGGNFTNYGWSPPNYTAMEKMLMGWLTAVELSEPTSITDMKPVEEGGQCLYHQAYRNRVPAAREPPMARMGCWCAWKGTGGLSCEL